MTGRALSVRFVDMPDSPRIQRLRADIDVGRPGAVEEFWREVTAAGTPLVEPSDDGHALVTFLLRAEARHAKVYRFGDGEMDRLPGTDLWYRTERVPRDLRTNYWFSLDGAAGIPPARRARDLPRVQTNPRPLTFPC